MIENHLIIEDFAMAILGINSKLLSIEECTRISMQLLEEFNSLPISNHSKQI